MPQSLATIKKALLSCLVRRAGNDDWYGGLLETVLGNGTRQKSMNTTQTGAASTDD